MVASPLRGKMRGGVLPTSFTAPLRMALVGAETPCNAWSKIIGTPICQGHNDIYSDCVTTAAVNASIQMAAKNGVMVPVSNQVPLDLFIKLGGMPANEGLDPAVLFQYWQQNAIAGYRLADIRTVNLNDIDAQREAVKNAILYTTARLTVAQQTQAEWVPTPNAPAWANHAYLPTWFEGPNFYVDSWGEEIPQRNDFLPAQGLNAWRLTLVAA